MLLVRVFFFHVLDHNRLHCTGTGWKHFSPVKLQDNGYVDERMSPQPPLTQW